MGYKIRIMRKGAHQEVTGIVVNEKADIPRKKLRQSRAVLHQPKTKEASELTLAPIEDRFGIELGLRPSLLGLCSDFPRAHPNIPRERPNKFRTLSTVIPAQFRRQPKQCQVLPKTLKDTFRPL